MIWLCSLLKFDIQLIVFVDLYLNIFIHNLPCLLDCSYIRNYVDFKNLLD